jgi:hypothetical protein
VQDAWFGKTHYQTWLCLRKYHYADLAFSVSSPGLGNTAIPNHIYKGTDSLKSTHSLDRFAPPPTLGSGDEIILMEVQSLQTLNWKIEENRVLYIRRNVKTFN